MLNRRILRIKAFKAIYAYAENPAMSLADVEAYFEASCEAVRDLYLFLLSSIRPLTDEASARLTAARTKFNPTEEERNPNMKFSENSLASYFESDPDFAKICGKKKFAWDQYDVLLYNLYNSLVTRDYYKDYMAKPERSLKDDAQLWINIFENEFDDNQELIGILEDLNLFWEDDLTYALICCCRTLHDVMYGKQWSLPPLFVSELPGNEKMDSDKAFAVNVIRKAYNNYDRYLKMVDERTPKWELDRICVTDLCLIACGLAESEALTNIPGNITINEYVEISKYYSTPESRQFVNGVLDRIINKKD